MTLSAAMAEIKANPGKTYVYILSRPGGTPFYVGIGSGRRIMAHERNACERWRGYKYSLIRKIIRDGGTVGYSVEFVKDRATACVEEKRLIALYGRMNMRTGPLANLTEGGEDIVAGPWVLTPARAAGAKRAGEKLRGRKASAEARAKMSAFQKGRKRSPEAIAKTTAALKARGLSPDEIRKLGESRRGLKMPSNTRKGLAKWRAENPGGLSKAQKAAWQDPELRRRMSEKLKGRKMPAGFSEKQKAAQKIKFSDPEFLARWTAARLAGIALRKAQVASGERKSYRS
jgi:hypothetical protein